MPPGRHGSGRAAPVCAISAGSVPGPLCPAGRFRVGFVHAELSTQRSESLASPGPTGPNVHLQLADMGGARSARIPRSRFLVERLRRQSGQGHVGKGSVDETDGEMPHESSPPCRRPAEGRESTLRRVGSTSLEPIRIRGRGELAARRRSRIAGLPGRRARTAPVAPWNATVAEGAPAVGARAKRVGRGGPRIRR